VNPARYTPGVMSTTDRPFYVTTPIYYVNDAPHVGHCYTTLVADALARAHRAMQGPTGGGVFFLTGTDEHSERVVEAATERGLTARAWADRNADAFRAAFSEMRFSHDDFVRTSEERHKAKVIEYISELQRRGAVELGEYVGWWDHSQEEYVTETTAREHDFKSPVTGKALVRRTEHNYFFKLSRYAERLQRHIETNPGFIRPEARRNEVLGRIKGGLQDVPVSRAAPAESAAGQWAITMPGDEGHRVYVWIDALFNYMSVIDTPERSRFWPAQVHTMAKDILWFHAVVWPCMLMALDKPLPECVYAHSYWIREGRKMSKSLGNFIDMPTLRAYIDRYSLDAVRWFLLTNGPLGATDADFAHAKFVEVYNADLANGIGNAASRVSNMIAKYFDGKCPKPEHDEGELPDAARRLASEFCADMCAVRLAEGVQRGVQLGAAVDRFIHSTEPFKLAKDPANMAQVGTILYHCAEALRIAAVLLSPAMPDKMADLLQRFGQPAPDAQGRFEKPLSMMTAWGRLEAGTPIEKGEALFPRADTADEPPAPVAG
jgi:methionyl-tRNA synthetase